MPRLLEEANYSPPGYYIGNNRYYYIGDYGEQYIYNPDSLLVQVINKPTLWNPPEPEIPLLFKILLGNDF